MLNIPSLSMHYISNPQERRLTGRPIADGGIVYKEILTDGTEVKPGKKSRKTAELEKFINEAQIHIGL
jgi:hypothetical protein